MVIKGMYRVGGIRTMCPNPKHNSNETRPFKRESQRESLRNYRGLIKGIHKDLQKEYIRVSALARELNKN